MRSSCPEPKRSGGVTVKPVQSTSARVVRHSTSLMSQTSHCYIYTLRHEYSGLERASAVQLWTENVFLCQMEGRLWPTESPVWTSSNWTFPEPSPLSSSSRRYFICEQRFNGVNQSDLWILPLTCWADASFSCNTALHCYCMMFENSELAGMNVVKT